MRLQIGFLFLHLCAIQSMGQTAHNCFIPLPGGDSLDAAYYVPSATPPSRGFPTLIFIHGFGSSKYSDTADCAVYARMGFLTLCYSVRGHGNSSGLSTIMATQERLDLRSVVQWTKGLPGVDSTLIGIVGGSQGGLHGLWAAADDIGVQAVSADVIVPHWASDLLANGSIRRLMLFLLRTSTVRYAAERDTLWELIRRDAYDSLLTRFASARDVGTSELDSSRVPLLLLLKFQDHYFDAGDGAALMGHYTGEHKLYLGTGGHFSDPSSTERTRQSGFVTRWMKYFLMGDSNGVVNEKPVSFAESTLPMTGGYFAWVQGSDLDQWPPQGAVMQSLYFGADSSLTSIPSSGADTIEIDNEYRDTTYTFDRGFVEGFKGVSFDAALPTASRRFYSAPLSSDMVWAGAPVLTLNVDADRAAFPLHARIFEVDTAGNRYFVNRVNFTARHWTPGERKVITVEGITHAHRFTLGNRIMVELTNIDRDLLERPEIGGQAFVVPLFAVAHPRVIVGGSQPSSIALPLLQTPSAVVEAVEQPGSFVLMQNYPNPFNPVTMINYTVGQGQDLGTLGFGEGGRNVLVQLTVYDILGRQVATLVNEPQAPGHYQVRFDGAGLSSGVYLYRLTAGGVSMAKKMVLLK